MHREEMIETCITQMLKELKIALLDKDYKVVMKKVAYHPA